MLKDKHIVLGVTGGIAAYKAAELVSRLKKAGAHVTVVMTEHATRFVSSLTFQSLSQNYVVTDMFEEPKTWDVEHISIAKRADAFVIAPATANVIGKMAAGIADDMLTTTVMATQAPVLIAPAMNTNMYLNPITQRNIETLKGLGYLFEDPTAGRLACADVGMGKMAEPAVLVDRIDAILTEPKDLKGVRILITAGPTCEAIDPVRYITNRSSGKMGYALARQAVKRGAEVILISGKTQLEIPSGVEYIPVESAEEMYQAVMDNYKKCQAMIKAAAVADYKPSEYVGQKIKKADEDLNIHLSRTQDIAKALGAVKENRIFVGFAAETQDLLENAAAKVKSKQFDFIVANNVAMRGAGFNSDTNIVTLLDSQGNCEPLELMDKAEVANKVLDRIVKTLKDRSVS